MRYLLTILFVGFSICSFAQKADSADLVRCVADLNKALLKRDTIRLKLLLANDLHYYHSSGWLQSKREVMDDLYNGKLTYKTIIPSGQQVHFISNELAEVQATVGIDAVFNGSARHLDLDVVQSWRWVNERWELISRVSKRVEKQG